MLLMPAKDFLDIDAISAIRLKRLQDQGLRRTLSPTERMADGRVIRAGKPMMRSRQ
jgi:hypothetical protein